MIPPELAAAIEDEASAALPSDLAIAAGELSVAYRSGRPGAARLDLAHHALAYIVCRMPATYGACAAALGELAESLPSFAPRDAVDLGAGSGAASWAACGIFDSIERVELIEREERMIALGRRLAEGAPSPAFREARWRRAELSEIDPPPADLILLSYALGESSGERRSRTLRAAWKATRGVLFIIEPGTPEGFAAVRAARGELIGLGGHVAAPCPHDGACPMEGLNWCHFAARVERSRRHRMAKGGDLGWEDEKFSWCAVSREPAPPRAARIVAPPRVSKGDVRMEICAAEGLRDVAIARRDAERYRRAKKARWGERRAD